MSSPAPPLELVLASSSRYRRELLGRLRLPFRHQSPDIDESPLPAESAGQLVRRLARAKARALAGEYPAALIIGSDQAAALGGDGILGKPGDFEHAFEQLKACGGRTISFHTGLCLLNTKTGQDQVMEEIYEVRFRQLSDEAIERYLRAEEPYDCAGSFRMEGLGITLFDAFAGRDPNSLIGLPLMGLCDMLRNEGWQLP